MFVPELDERDVVDIYRLRRVLEVDVVRGLADRVPELPANRLEPLQDDVEAASTCWTPSEGWWRPSEGADQSWSGGGPRSG